MVHVIKIINIVLILYFRANQKFYMVINVKTNIGVFLVYVKTKHVDVVKHQIVQFLQTRYVITEHVIIYKNKMDSHAQ